MTAKNYLRGDTHWPKPWLGEPTTIIHRASNHGLFGSSNPIQSIRLGRGRMWQTGVPEILRVLVAELIGKATTGPPGQKSLIMAYILINCMKCICSIDSILSSHFKLNIKI
jgi:hypothetical protein